jgi:hypothetical protein
MTVSHRQKRWKRAHEQGWPHGCKNAVYGDTLRTELSNAMSGNVKETWQAALTEDVVVELRERGKWKVGDHPAGGVRSVRSACILKNSGQDLSKDIMFYTILYANVNNRLVFGEFFDIPNATNREGPLT